MSQNMKRVLVIEDEDEMRALYCELLRNEGFDVEEASDGKEGFQKATREKYFLIVCDLMMPEWNGALCIKGIQMIHEEAKFIVVTGFYNDPICEQVEALPNIVKIFKKPLDIEQFVDVVNSIH